MPTNCVDCGADITRKPGCPKYCHACYWARRRTPVRIAAPGRARAGCYAPIKAGGLWVCLDCGEPVEQHFRSGGLKRRAPLRCRDCGAFRRLFLDVLSGRDVATQITAHARRSGRLAPATDFACVDCARPAEQYDHRDYGEPLNVVPVCRSCNVMRGPAKPLDQVLVLALIAANASSFSALPISSSKASQRGRAALPDGIRKRMGTASG